MWEEVWKGVNGCVVGTIKPVHGQALIVVGVLYCQVRCGEGVARCERVWVGGDQAPVHWQVLILPAVIPTMVLDQPTLRRLLLLLPVHCRRLNASSSASMPKCIIPQFFLRPF